MAESWTASIPFAFRPPFFSTWCGISLSGRSSFGLDRPWSGNDRLGNARFWRAAMAEQAAHGQEFGVQEGGAGCAAHQIVRQQRELHIQQRAFTNAADDGGHAPAEVGVAAGLR